MSGKKIKNKEHNMTNPYDFDKLEYEKGYKGCAKSGSGSYLEEVCVIWA